MRGIQCFSSRPIREGWRLMGSFSEGKIEIPYLQLLTMQLSVIQWKRTNGPVKLYTDRATAEYLDRRGLLTYWDSVDTELLEEMDQTHPGIDSLVFWSASKIFCYERERAPFICFDTDLIAWRALEFASDTALGFAHWESVERGDANYLPLRRLHTPPRFRFYPGGHICRHAVNMAVTYIGSETLRKEFTGEAFRFMEGNRGIPVTEGTVTPELLYMEQRLPYLIARRNRLKWEPVLNTVWSPKRFRFLRNDERYGDWSYAALDAEKPITHIWFHKEYLSQNQQALKAYTDELIKWILLTGNNPIRPTPPKQQKTQ